MWKRRTGKHLASNVCQHRKTTTSPNAGLEFTVCNSYGQITIRYLHAVMEDDIDLADAESSN